MNSLLERVRLKVKQRELDFLAIEHKGGRLKIRDVVVLVAAAMTLVAAIDECSSFTTQLSLVRYPCGSVSLSLNPKIRF